MSGTEEKPEKSENEEESPGEPAEAQDETGIDKDIKKLSVEDTKPEEEIGIVSLCSTGDNFYSKILISMTLKSKLPL